MRGAKEMADEWRKAYKDWVHELLQEPGEGLTRSAFAEIVRAAALEVLGTEQVKEKTPWLLGRDEAIADLGRVVEATRARCKGLLGQPRPWTAEAERAIAEAKGHWNRATRLRKRTPREWEDAWWEEVARDAKEAVERGTTGSSLNRSSSLR